MRISDWSSDVCSSDLVAAGGVMDGRGIAAALALGAAGVQMGTAFLGCPESGASETHKTMLGQARDDRTVVTRAFSRSEEHTSELQSLMRISYAVFCLKKKNKQINIQVYIDSHWHTN